MKKNPVDYVITAFKHSTGSIGYWTGANWDTDPALALRSHTAASLEPLADERRQTLPRGWRVGVQPAPGEPIKNPAKRSTAKKRAVRKNPVPASKYAKMKEASERYREFTGMDPEFYDAYQVDRPDVAYVLGVLDFVGYTAVRDGQTEKYKHTFKQNSRPLLCVTHDGKNLVIVGGRYHVTERGVEDV